MKKIFVIFVLMLLEFGCKGQIKPLQLCVLDQTIYSVSFNNIDSRLAVLTKNSVKLLSLSGNKDIEEYSNIGEIINGEILFTNDLIWIGAGNKANGALFYLNTNDGTSYQFSKEKYAEVYAISLLKDKKVMVTGHANGEIVLWDLITKKKKLCFGDYDTEVCTLLIASDENTLYSGNAMGSIAIWDIESGEKRKYKKIDNSSIYTLSFNKKTNSLMCGGINGEGRGILYILDNELSVQREIEFNKGAVLSCDSQYDTGKIICGLTNGYIATSEYNGSDKKIFKLHKDDVLYVGFVDQGRKVVTVSKDGVIKLWDGGS